MPETIPQPKPEARPPAPLPKEAPKSEKPAKAPEGTARATLEKIASGTPVMEATSPKEPLPSRDTVDSLLAEGNTILLELKDLRLWVNSIALQATDSHLGNELRIDSLRNLLTINAKELEPLQEKIRALNLPEAKPTESALLALDIPEEIKMKIRAGDAGAAETVATMLQSNEPAAKLIWKELAGQENLTQVPPNPDRMLDLAGIDKTPDNVEKANELFEQAKQAKTPFITPDQIMTGFMYGALFIQAFSQIALGEGGGGH